MPRTARGAWIAGVVALTSGPYLFARLIAPAGSAYNWILPPYPEDGVAYLAWVKQAALGAWLFKLKYTALPHPAIVFNPFFLASGLLCRAFGAQPGLILFLLKGAGVALFLLALERFLRRFPLTPEARVTALALVSLSSGAGFLAAWGWLPSALSPTDCSDLWLVDLNTLWSLTWNPLFPFALALMVYIFDLWLDDRDEGRTSRLALAGGLTSLLALIHPYDVVIVGLVAVAIAAKNIRRGLRTLAVFAAAAAPGVLYQLWASAQGPVYAAHAALGAMPSPTAASLLWGFGLSGLLALLATALLARRRRLAEFGPVLAWAAAAMTASRAPIWFQRKLLFGAHIPICILAAVGADALISRACENAGGQRRRAYAALAATLILATMPTHLVTLAQSLGTLLVSGDRGPYFVSADLREAFGALALKSRPSDIVLASPGTSLMIPPWSGNTVLYGHWAQSVDYDARLAQVENLMNPASGLPERSRLEGLRQTGAKFVLVDEGLLELGGGAPPRWMLKAGKIVFAGPRVQILRLNDDANIFAE